MAEFISKSGPYAGKTFDSVGLPLGKSVHHAADMKGFKDTLYKHMLNSKADYGVLDLRHMTAAQRSSVLDFVRDNFQTIPKIHQNKLIIIR